MDKDFIQDEQTDYKEVYLKLKRELVLLETGFTYEEIDKYIPLLKRASEEDYEDMARFFYESKESKQKQSKRYADPSNAKPRTAWNPFR